MCNQDWSKDLLEIDPSGCRHIVEHCGFDKVPSSFGVRSTHQDMGLLLPSLKVLANSFCLSRVGLWPKISILAAGIPRSKGGKLLDQKLFEILCDTFLNIET